MAEIGHDLLRAKAILESGGLVAIPTETVYGLAGNALDSSAILKIYKAKNRPSFDPLICHVGELDQIDRLVEIFPPIAREVASKYWPGPLTFLLPKKSNVPDLLTSGLPNVAVRIPDHSLTQQLLATLDFPLAAPSANPFGYVSPTRPDHVNSQLGDRVDYILDGGACRVGIESTIVSFEKDDLIIHRLGGLKTELLEPYGNIRLELNQNSNPNAPGQLSSHYSPGKILLIGDLEKLLTAHSDKGLAVISFQKQYASGPSSFVLSKTGNLDEAAAQLFGVLRACDSPEIDLILAERFPDQGLGRAINDRLLRAASSI